MGEKHLRVCPSTSAGGSAFVTSTVRPGLLPLVLADLLEARSKARADLKATTDAVAGVVLQCRQVCAVTTVLQRCAALCCCAVLSSALRSSPLLSSALIRSHLISSPLLS